MGQIHIHIEADSAEEYARFVRVLAGGAPDFIRPFEAKQPEPQQATPEPAPVSETKSDFVSNAPEVPDASGTSEAEPEPAAPPKPKVPPKPTPRGKLKETLQESLAQEEAKTNGATQAEAPKEEPKAAPQEKLTRESVSGAMNNYIGAFGSAAAVTDFKVMCAELFGVDKLSQIPDEQESFAKMIAAVDAAIASNRFGRKSI